MTDQYNILINLNKKDEVLQKLEDLYKKIITNNDSARPIMITINNQHYKFSLPVELRAFILGMRFFIN